MKRKIIYIFVWSVLVVGLAVLLGFVIKKHESTRCREIRISIHYPGGDFFVSKQDIRHYMEQMGDSLKGEPLSKIDIETLERMIRNNPYVANADVYLTLDGIVNIEVFQRKAIVRVQNMIDQCYYISDDGRLMPLNQGKPAYVPLANGQIKDIFMPGLNLNVDTSKQKKDTSVMKTALYSIYKIAQYIARDTFLTAQTEQIYLNSNGDFELIPLVGRHIIILGDAHNLEEKFDNLLVFYRQGLSAEGWDKYDTINLKFHNQVVATNIEKNQLYGIK